MSGKTKQHELEGLELGHRFSYDGADGEQLVRVLSACHNWGYSLRVGPVGYGTAIRFVLTDIDANVFGVTVGSAAELNALLRGLLAPGAEEYVKRQQEPARGRRRR